MDIKAIMIYRALIPVKSLSEVKSRLALHLTQAQRSALVLEMLYHVLYVLHESKIFEKISVVSPDEHVLERAQKWGAEARIEEQQGHNPALQSAANRELVAGATALLTISADLPLLQANEIHGMVDALMHYEVVLAPSRDGTGTNALLVRPPLALPYVFGVNSLQRYKEEARQSHLRTITYVSDGLAFDIDTISDLKELRGYRTDPLSTSRY
jgi:2-phospho-L-lactate guanylyltransferase